MRTQTIRFSVAALVAVAGVLAATSARATVVITPRPEAPGMHHAIELSRQDVVVDLTDRAAEVDVTWTYRNISPHRLEGTFLFPLPPNAAVDRFSLFVDGEEIRADLLDADQARREYESIVRRMKDPALLEYAGRALLKARIFPIEPRADASVRLQYTHPLVADFGVTDFVFPFTRDQLAGDARQSLTATITTNADLKSITSPTHDVEVERSGERAATVTHRPKRAHVGDDFHLLCTYDAKELGAQFLTTVDDEGQGYFMAIIAPGEVKDDLVLPKDIVFCFDRSGSMAGEKIVQARDALRFCLNRLNSEDRFGLVVFNDRIESYATDLRAPSRTELRAAGEFVGRVDADGGTNIEGALRQTLSMFTKGDRPKYLVFLTDGRPTVGTRNPQVIRDAVKERNTHGARIFTFGVGHDLNAGLLNDLADDGRGQASYVAPREDVEIAVSRFYSKIKAPVLADCELDFKVHPTPFSNAPIVSAVYPDPLPDLFAGAEAVVLGRFEGRGDVTVRLTGTRGSEKLNHTFEPVFEPKPERYGFIPKLWAARRIGFLMEEVRRHGKNAELRDEIVRLSKRHGIMTKYTAFLAAPEAVRRVQVIGGGWDAVGGGTARDRAAIPVPQPEQDASSFSAGGAMNLRAIDAAKMKKQASTQSFGGDRDDLAALKGMSAAPSVAIEGYQFTLMDDGWTDWKLVDSTTVPTDTVTIAPYSEAHFKLASHPQLAKILAIGGAVRFVWRDAVIVITDGGTTEWKRSWNRLIER